MEGTGATESMLSEFITPLSGRRARLRALFDRDLFSIMLYLYGRTYHSRKVL